MPVKIIHAADLHLDSAFSSLSPEKATLRRRDQRNVLYEIAKLQKSQGADLVLLSGDIFDSTSTYAETDQALIDALGQMDAHVFIAPGNHDYYCLRSSYNTLNLPENVHVFRSESIDSVTIPALNCRVWGAGFMSDKCRNLLEGFSVSESDMTEIMVLHADLSGGDYNPITQAQIENSGLDYLALGHIHTFSGIQRAGNTFYSYPGCPEGRGFDETGVKGIVAGTVQKGDCTLRFVPIPGHRYLDLTVSVTGKDPKQAILNAVSGAGKGDFCRVRLVGECSQKIDITELTRTLSDNFADISLNDDTMLIADLWQDAGRDDLRGVALEKLRKIYDESDSSGRENATLAAKFLLAAMDNFDLPEMGMQ